VPDVTEVSEPPGPAWCRAWTAAVDAELAGALADLGPDRAVSVVALGGYARRELCPASDVDLLILHDGWERGDLEALVRALCYPLWDAGLSVGHAVRTVREAVRAAGERVDTATALTDRRLVAGDGGLADALTGRTQRWLRRHGGDVLSDLAAADAARHGRAGALPGMLEPDLKSGAGGLRDLHSLRWAAACVLGEVGLDPLVGARYLSAVDRRDLAAAAGDLLSARCALHLVQGRGARDVLRLDLQDEVAARLGWGDGDDLLRRVGLATRLVAHVHGRTWAPLLADATQGRRRRHQPPEPLDEGVVLADGLVELTGPADLDADPSVGLRSVAAAAERGVHLGRIATERLRSALRDARTTPIPVDEAGRRALLRTLAAGDRGLGAMADADHLGLLAAHLPQWAAVRGRPQRNPYHRFDLDTHGARAVCELVAIAEGADTPERAAVWRGLADPDAVLLGTFLHDVGKAWPPRDHSEVGAEVAAGWVSDLGYGRDRAAMVRRLVRHHLLLPDAATRRDIDDPEEVAAVARACGDVETLDGLYLLCLADARATGPSAHSPWKDGLIAELHARARAALAEDPASLPSAAAPQALVVPAPDARATPRPSDAIPDDERYLRAAGPEQVAAHARLLDPPPRRGEVHAAWRPGADAGTEVLSVVAADRAGFLADCAGVLAARGLRVLEARLFTTDTAVPLALDWFVVEVDEGVDRDGVVDDLRQVAAGRVTVDQLLARRESRRDVRPPPLAAPIEVHVRFDIGPLTTRVEVHGPDAPGVLSRLAATLSEAGLEVQGARVATLGPEVRDVFFLRTPTQEPAGGWDALAERLEAAAGWTDGATAVVRSGYLE
jgi:[protein-PII] uridylyltransferase